MTKRARTTIFLICLFLFILITPVAVLYSQGYRLDFNPPAGGKIITQTGGLFLKILPKQVEVYLDGNLKKKTDFFFGSVLIENLLPKKYTIRVQKEGFYPWEKVLEIKEKEVTEAENIVLFPKNPNFSILIKGVGNFWFSPDQKNIILKEENKNGWSLKLYELDKNIKSHLIKEDDFFSTFTPINGSSAINEADISSKGADLFKLSFLEDPKKILLGVGVEDQIKYYVLNIERVPPALTESGPSVPPVENAVVYKEINGDVYYLDSYGNLFKNDLILTGESFPVEQETEYKLEVFQNHIFLKESKALYQLNPESKSFEKIFDETKGFKISPDSNKLVYFSDYEIWILYLEDEFGQPQRKAGEKIFLIRLSEKIQDCFWLNANYLIFVTGNKIKISEIDTRDKINVIDIANFETPEIFWNKTNKRLYILSNGNLYSSGTLSF